MPWCAEKTEYVVLCTAPDGTPVVALAGAFRLTYEADQLALIHAYLHYIDEYNERADAWVRVELFDAGVAAKGAEPLGDAPHYSLVSECWDGSWDSWADEEAVASEDAVIFEALGDSLMRLAIDDDAGGAFMIPRDAIRTASRSSYILGFEGETACHTGRFNRELLLGAVSRSLPRSSLVFDLPWDLDGAREPLPRPAKSEPPAYRFLLRFQNTALSESASLQTWFEAFCETCSLVPVNAVVDAENDVVVAAALGAWSIFELDTGFIQASRSIEEELLVVDLDHARCQYYYSGCLEDSETLDILSEVDLESLRAHEVSFDLVKGS